MLTGMTPTVLRALREQQFSLCQRWEALLRIEPVNTPLALPDALSHLIPASVDQILHELARPGAAKLTLPAARKIHVPECGCNRNPYLAHFKAGEQAFLETLVLLQAEWPATERRPEDLADVVRAIRTLAGAEIDTFCGVCTHHGESAACRHYVPVSTL